MSSEEAGYPIAHSWSVEAVNGDKITVLAVGEIVMLHTGDGREHGPEMLMARLAEGNPVELTRPQLGTLVEILIRILDGPKL